MDENDAWMDPIFKKIDMFKDGKITVYKCKICGREFLNMFECFQHTKLHFIQYPYFCFQCKEAFKSIGEARKHWEETHKKDYPNFDVYLSVITFDKITLNEKLKEL